MTALDCAIYKKSTFLLMASRAAMWTWSQVVSVCECMYECFVSGLHAYDTGIISARAYAVLTTHHQLIILNSSLRPVESLIPDPEQRLSGPRAWRRTNRGGERRERGSL